MTGALKATQLQGNIGYTNSVTDLIARAYDFEISTQGILSAAEAEQAVNELESLAKGKNPTGTIFNDELSASEIYFGMAAKRAKLRDENSEPDAAIVDKINATDTFLEKYTLSADQQSLVAKADFAEQKLFEVDLDEQPKSSYEYTLPTEYNSADPFATVVALAGPANGKSNNWVEAFRAIYTQKNPNDLSVEDASIASTEIQALALKGKTFGAKIDGVITPSEVMGGLQVKSAELQTLLEDGKGTNFVIRRKQMVDDFLSRFSVSADGLHIVLRND